MRQMSMMSQRSSRKEKRAVLVLGATGLVGGAVARALLSFPWFKVFVGTRRPWCSEALLLRRAGEAFCALLPRAKKKANYNIKNNLYLLLP